MTSNLDASTFIRQRYEAWAQALRTHAFGWLGDNLADDYQFTARPYPDLRLDKVGFIEADKKMSSADIRFVVVQATRLGDTIISTAIADVAETFSGELGPHMPTLEQMGALLGRNRLAYASAWRKAGERWQCYHHHMIGPVGG